MTDETMFERRLADALGRYADRAPTMDDEVVALTAIRTGGRPRLAWLGWVADTFRSAGTSRNGMRMAYLLVLLALVLAAILAAAVGGFSCVGPRRFLDTTASSCIRSGRMAIRR